MFAKKLMRIESKLPGSRIEKKNSPSFFPREHDKKSCNLIVANLRAGNPFSYLCPKTWVTIERGVVWRLSVMSAVRKNISIRFAVSLSHDTHPLSSPYLKSRLPSEDTARWKLSLMESLLYGTYWKRVPFSSVLYHAHAVNLFTVSLTEKLVLATFFVERVRKWRVKSLSSSADSNIKFTHELLIITLVKFFYRYLNSVTS